MELAPDYWLNITTASGSRRTCTALPRNMPGPIQPTTVVHASIVPCHANLLAGLRGEHMPETHAADNLRTMRLVYTAYESAASGEVMRL